VMFCQPTFAKAVRVRFPVRQSSCPLSRVGTRAGGQIGRGRSGLGLTDS